MPRTSLTFYINYCEKDVLVSPDMDATGNYFTVHLEEGDVKLKSEGWKTKLWLEKGKGATSLAFTLGQLIDA